MVLDGWTNCSDSSCSGDDGDMVEFEGLLFSEQHDFTISVHFFLQQMNNTIHPTTNTNSPTTHTMTTAMITPDEGSKSKNNK